MAEILSVNPATEEVLASFPSATARDVKDSVARARKAFAHWRQTPAKERAKIARKAGKILLKKKKELGELCSLEMGKPIKEAVPEIEKCAWLAEYFAEKAPGWLADEIVETDAKKSYIAFEPMGVVAAIMPWNFPFWQPLRAIIPAMLAGNCVVLKHSSTVPQAALKIAEIFSDAGVPEGVLQALLGRGELGSLLAASKGVDGVTFTGSVAAGSHVAAIASKDIKKVVLELGGSDPFIVLEDADLRLACEKAAAARLLNCGQSCIAAKRFIVVRKVAKEFTEGLVAAAKAMKVGDPLEPDTDVGPLANREQLEKIISQVEDAKKKGARVLTGGFRPDRKGYFYMPAVLTNVSSSMRIVTEEVFGPAAPVIPVKDEDEAVEVANSTEYGLGGSVWTADRRRGERVARRLAVGVASVNQGPRSDPRLPFGGTKKSGVGRELGRYGLLEFVNMKSVKVF